MAAVEKTQPAANFLLDYSLPCAVAALLPGYQPSTKETTASTVPFPEPSAWTQDGIWYQVFS
jgi:hypothetical protein